MFFQQRKVLLLRSRKYFDVVLLTVDQMHRYCDLDKTTALFFGI